MTKLVAAFLLGLLVASAVAQSVQTTFTPVVVVPKTVVGSLPTCDAGAEGRLYGVTDALVPVALAAVAGGGAVHVMVYCNGTSWIVG